ncbi:MAG: anti-sigma factor family protein [Coraliomargarita sp.]
MTDQKFRELVNLYLDKEIDSDEMELLQAAISSDAARQREFDTSCRLHHAMRSALETEVAGNEKACSVSRNRVYWILGLGMAASFVLGGVLLRPVLTDSNGLTEAEAQDARHSAELLQQRQEHFKRYLAVQRQQEQQACGLAAKLRLLGLDPALVPADSQLEPVDLTVKRVHVEWVGNEPHWTVEQIYRVGGGADNPHAVIRVERSSIQAPPIPDFLIADDYVGGFQFIGE